MKNELSPLVESIKSGMEARNFYVLFREDASRFSNGELEEIAQEHDWELERRDGCVLFQPASA
jgi:hypothetical protein